MISLKCHQVIENFHAKDVNGIGVPLAEASNCYKNFIHKNGIFGKCRKYGIV